LERIGVGTAEDCHCAMMRAFFKEMAFSSNRREADDA
jgi:hypothetical protein